MAVTFNHEPSELELKLVNAIDDVHSKSIVFNNIIFDCERIEDAAGHVFKRDDPCETTAIDQRKMLEADALELYDNVSIYGGKSTFTGQDLIDLLDRQAAITERECLERAAKSDELGQHFRAVMAENRELHAKLDELESGNAVEQQRDHWHSIAVGVYRRFYPRGEYGVPDDPSACTGDPLGMINDAIDAIERERDEWKAKAEDASTGECEKLSSLTDMECIVRMGNMERHCGYWRCSECGCENFEGAKHCMNCGRKGVDRWART